VRLSVEIRHSLRRTSRSSIRNFRSLPSAFCFVVNIGGALPRRRYARVRSGFLAKAAMLFGEIGGGHQAAATPPGKQ
jgi:hypothetical protein